MRYSIYLFVIICLNISGCVSAPELTPEQVTQINVECNDEATCVIERTNKALEVLAEEIQYQREIRELERIEKWQATVAWCDQHADMTMWYTSRGPVSVRQKRTGIPDRGTDYGCANTAETIRTIMRGY